MSVMAKEPKSSKKQPEQSQTPKVPAPRKGKSLNVWISEVVRDTLDEAIEQSRPKAKINAHVEEALIAYLTELGFWPPKPKGGDK